MIYFSNPAEREDHRGEDQAKDETRGGSYAWGADQAGVSVWIKGGRHD